MPPPPPDTLNLGGGLSGRLAAWHLQNQGRKVEVWEASDSPGGWVQTLPWPGPSGEPGWLERGPQSLRVLRGGALGRLLEELDLEGRPSPRGPRWLGKGGRRHPSPASLAGLLGAPGMGLLDTLRLLGEPFAAQGTAPDESLRAFFARRLGEGFARELLPALVAGLLAAPPERLGLEALPRLPQLEARGGLLLGGLRRGREGSLLLAGGTGALARALAQCLGCLRTGRAARALEPRPGGWRVHGEGFTQEARTLVLALPPPAAAALLRPLAPEAGDLLGAIPGLDLRVWHSRHPILQGRMPGWEGGFGLLVHPPEGRGLLGAVSFPTADPRGVSGLLQVRSYLGGAYPVEPALEAWPGVFEALRRWLPELPEALQVREERCPGAFPLLAPGHGGRVRAILEALPPGIAWIGAARFGPGVPDLAEGIEAWAAGLPRMNSDEH